MQSRYEVWRYSNSWKKWVRDIYRDSDLAQERYEYLLRRGKTVRAPQPFQSGLPITTRVGFMVGRLLARKKPAAPALHRPSR